MPLALVAVAKPVDTGLAANDEPPLKLELHAESAIAEPASVVSLIILNMHI